MIKILHTYDCLWLFMIAWNSKTPEKKHLKTMRIYGFQRKKQGEKHQQQTISEFGTLTTSSMTCITWAWPNQLMAIDGHIASSYLKFIGFVELKPRLFPDYTQIIPMLLDINSFEAQAANFKASMYPCTNFHMEDPTSCNFYGLISKSGKIGRI